MQIVDGDFKYGLEEFTIPGLAFLYIAGWIGYVGRQYLNEIKYVMCFSESEIYVTSLLLEC